MSDIKDVINDISVLQCFGFSPMSASTKPAHIANAWFRRILGRYYDPVILNRTVKQWVKTEEINPSAILISDYEKIFEPFAPQNKSGEFTDFRRDLRALLSPVGGAVNRGNENSTYNITCAHHITSDRMDFGTGDFLYRLLNTDLGNGPSSSIELLRNILLEPTDEVSALTFPLVADAKAKEVGAGTYRAETVFRTYRKDFVSPTLRTLREGFDKLTVFERTYGGGLDALRRHVALGVFSILLYMQNRHGELTGNRTLTPMLLYFHERQRTTSYQASHATYNLNRRAIESLYTSQFKTWLEDRLETDPTSRQCKAFIKELEFGKNGAKSREYLSKSYRSFANQMDALDAMSEALRDAAFRASSATPLDFYRGLGIRIGFVRPAGNRAVKKHYTLEGVLLEAVLASIIPEGKVPYQQFLDLLYDRYGLLTGGRPQDSQLLIDNGVGNATVQDLRANSTSFRQQLLSLGWAQQYADGVLVVRAPEGLQ